MNVSGAASAGALTLATGTLGGAGTMTVKGLLTWSGGTMSGAGITNANGGLDINGGNAKNLNQRTLNNAATATWTGAGNHPGRCGEHH
jgi:phage baseplate assembly protein gpV